MAAKTQGWKLTTLNTNMFSFPLNLHQGNSNGNEIIAAQITQYIITYEDMLMKSCDWPKILRHLFIIIVILVFSLEAGGKPMPKHGLHFQRPSQTWDEAIPLGNGLLGALVWGDGTPLKISLDRTDLWDLRPVPEFHTKEYSYETMRQWVKEGRLSDLHRLYDKPYGNPGPTKIPAGRIEVTIGDDPIFNQASLNLAEALSTVQFNNRTRVQVFIHATEPVGMIVIDSSRPVELELKVPPFAGKITEEAGPGKISAGDLASLRYNAPVKASGENWTGYLQEGWGGFKFAVVLAWKKNQNKWLAAWSIATSNESNNPVQKARKNCQRAISNGFKKSFDTHRKWWNSYWDKSSISIPNAVIERQWYLEMYKFGAATRPDTPPITLQGPWTADNGKIPPWKGDYHHDLNTELSYWPAYSGNQLEGAIGFVNWLWDTRKTARAWTKRFFDLPGLNVPMTADLGQKQIGGWHQYTHSATTAAWLAHHFYLHWRYGMDRHFLEERLYPWLEETSIFLEAVTEKGIDGKRTLPLSSSPEINDNRLDAWFTTITNYDTALIRWTFETTAELADKLGKTEDARYWRKILSEMPDLTIDPKSKKMLIAKDYPLKDSHRHFSHLMAIHPLGMIRWENGPEDQAIIKASLADLEQKGSSQWCGYSYSWLANLAARARDGEKAEKALEIFSTAFCLRNSFHCNGDQSGKGYSNYRYRPFTLEGNFAAAAGLQEMLLQSYSGTIRVFPAIPDSWKDVSFTTLRAEGAFLVSAERRNGVTQHVKISAEKDGSCRLENPFADSGFKTQGISKNMIKQKDNELHIKMSPGGSIVLIRTN
ncbi:MAG: glycoside hydrolase N-terminal domain-containing protein [Sedimentisphaerales bacterium]|nr:glycoside hydrolase N-terminal domain-containing protein [Sedimentisphaerales bacterium]